MYKETWGWGVAGEKHKNPLKKPQGTSRMTMSSCKWKVFVLNPPDARGVDPYKRLPHVLQDSTCISAINVLPMSPDLQLHQLRWVYGAWGSWGSGFPTSVDLQKEGTLGLGRKGKSNWRCLMAFAARTRHPSLTPFKCQAQMSPLWLWYLVLTFFATYVWGPFSTGMT